jgi:hypothetical protein
MISPAVCFIHALEVWNSMTMKARQRCTVVCVAFRILNVPAVALVDPEGEFLKQAEIEAVS